MQVKIQDLSILKSKSDLAIAIIRYAIALWQKIKKDSLRIKNQRQFQKKLHEEASYRERSGQEELIDK